jgi:hypothetical protein
MINATVMLDKNILRRQRHPQVRQAMNMEETDGMNDREGCRGIDLHT